MALINNAGSFDKYGNLLPYDLLKFTKNNAYHILVESFNPSCHREQLWDKLNKYRNDMCAFLSANGEQWIDGSYVTTKELPEDIDVVTYININDLVMHLNEFKRFTTMGGSKELYGIDGYIVPLFNISDPSYVSITKDRIDYWKNWFGHDRDNNPKGIVVLELPCS